MCRDVFYNYFKVSLEELISSSEYKELVISTALRSNT